MRRLVSSLTGPLPLRTLETVATDTFASRATSLIVTILLASMGRSSHFGSERVGRGDSSTVGRSVPAIARICNRLHRGAPEAVRGSVLAGRAFPQPPLLLNFR